MGRKAKYPWDLWLDGEWHTVLQGADYEISTYNFQVSLHSKARSLGRTVKTHSFRDGKKATDGLLEVREGLKFRFS